MLSAGPKSRLVFAFFRRAQLPLLLVICALLQQTIEQATATSRAPQALPVAHKHHLPSVSAEKARHVVNYQLAAQLSHEQRKIDGHARLQFTNTSSTPVSELYFHLYLNAFEHKKTLFFRNGSRSSNALRTPGHIEVQKLVSPSFGEKDLWTLADRHSPGDPDDRTDIRLPLPHAINSGEGAQFDIQFTAYLPEIVERTGFERNFYLVAQWFPKLAKLEENGNWAHFPFHSFAEFYSDFSDYQVTLDVPESFVVGSTGQLVRLPRAAGGRSIYEARARNVIDFAWTAWDQFEVEEVEAEGVQIRLLKPPGTSRLTNIIKHSVADGLRYLGQRFYPYPYPQLTVVLPPSYAQAGGGMEYPQFITTTGQAMTPWTGVRYAELMSVHELTHQWFQSTIATNEARFPFLDEGLTALVEWDYLDARFGSGGLLAWPGLTISRLAAARFGYFSLVHNASSAPIASSAADFDSFSDLSNLIYIHAPLCLKTLAYAFGPDTFERTFRTYAQRYQFKHPTADNFLDVVEQHMGKAARQQAQLMLYENGTLDLSLAETATKTENLNGGELRSSFVVHHAGILTLPYQIELTLLDGTVHYLSGLSHPGEHTYQFDHNSPLLKIELDPKHHILTDKNFFDNRRYFSIRPSQSRLRGLLFALSSWLLTFGTTG